MKASRFLNQLKTTGGTDTGAGGNKGEKRQEKEVTESMKKIIV
jgi:hypothetical protein